MALIAANGSRIAAGPNRTFSGVASVAGGHRKESIAVPHTHLNFASGWHRIDGVTDRSSVPQGARHPVAYKWPRKSGGLASHGAVGGSGALTGGGALGRNIAAALSGLGALSDAALGLIVSLSADLAGAGTLSDADLKAYLALAADLAGSGTLSDADLRALGWVTAALTGDGDVDALSTLTALGTLTADIRAYGALTPEGLRDAVWNAVAASYDASGTMGALMNGGAAGGMTTEQAQQLLEIFQRLGLDAGKPLTQTASEIKTDDWTLAVTETGGEVKVERQ